MSSAIFCSEGGLSEQRVRVAATSCVTCRVRVEGASALAVVGRTGELSNIDGVVFKGRSLIEILFTGAQEDTTGALAVLINLGCLTVAEEEVFLN